MLGIYTRLSRESEDSTSIENQTREGQEFATNKGYSPKIYNEGEGSSGVLEISKRPKLSELLTDIKQGEIKAVWMRNQNRLDRNTATFYMFVSVVKNAEIPVYFGDGDTIDFNDPNTLLQTTILSSLNQYQAHLQSKQTKKTLGDSAKAGKVWGIIPYGYARNEEKELIINEEQADIVKEIFALSLDGWGVKRIANHLSRRGEPTRMNSFKGKLKIVNRYDKSVTHKDYKDVVWSDNTVLGILRNRWYIGERIYQGIKYDTPIVIDLRTFNEAQEGLNSRVRTGGKRVEYRYLLKGLLRCGVCGRNYYGKRRANGKDNFYMCSAKRYPIEVRGCDNSSINITMLESFIIKHLFNAKDLLTHLENIDKTDNSLNELNQEYDQLIKRLEKENKAVQHLFNLMANPDLIGDSMLIDRYKSAKLNVENLENKVNAVKMRIDSRIDSNRFKSIENEVNGVDLSNFTALKESINKTIQKIEIQSSKDDFGKVFYTLFINYRGYDEVSTFTTSQPYKEWEYIYKAVKVAQDKSLGWVIRLNAINTQVAEGGLMPVIINDSDIIRFE